MLTVVVVLLSFIGSVRQVSSEEHASLDDLYKFIDDFGRETGRPRAEEVGNDTLTEMAYHMPKSAVDTLNAKCGELIESRKQLDAKEESDSHSDNSNSQSSEGRRRMAVDTVCVGDETVFCEPSSPVYSTGGAYEDIAVVLQSLGDASLLPTGVPSEEAIQSYTSADVWAVGLVAVRAATLLVDSASDFCDVAATCAGSVPIFGDLIECIVDATCTTVAIIANAVIAAAEFYLDYGDFHDGVLLTTQMQTLFEDREHIIANQKYLGNKMETLINALEEHIDEQFEILTDFVDERVSDLETLVNQRFSDLTELTVDLFNSQNQWLNTKLNDVSILLRTPNGRRPGWNDQNTDDIVEDPTTIEVPGATFNASDFN